LIYQRLKSRLSQYGTLSSVVKRKLLQGTTDVAQ